MNEALFYMGYLPEDTTKVLCLEKAVHSKKQEPLAEYYVRIDGHLLRDVKVFEVDEQGRIKVIKSKKCTGQYFGPSGSSILNHAQPLNYL